MLGRSESSVKWGPLASLSPGSSEISNVVPAEGKGLRAVLSLSISATMVRASKGGTLVRLVFTEPHICRAPAKLGLGCGLIGF